MNHIRPSHAALCRRGRLGPRSTDRLVMTQRCAEGLPPGYKGGRPGQWVRDHLALFVRVGHGGFFPWKSRDTRYRLDWSAALQAHRGGEAMTLPCAAQPETVAPPDLRHKVGVPLGQVLSRHTSDRLDLRIFSNVAIMPCYHP